MPLDFSKVNNDDLTDQSELDLIDSLEDEQPPDLTIGRVLGGFWQELKQWPSSMATSARSTRQRDINEIENDPLNIMNERLMSLPSGKKMQTINMVNQLTQEDDYGSPAMSHQEALRQSLLKVYKEMREETRDIEQAPAFQVSPEYKDQSSGLIENVARAIGGSLPDVAATMINPLAGAATMYQHIQGLTFKAMEDQGVEFERNFTASNISAAIQTPLELLGNLIQIKGMFGAGPFKKHIADLAESILGEFATEFVQEYPDQLAMFWAVNPNLSADDMRSALVGKALSTETLFQALESGVIGGLAGGVTTGGGKAMIGTVEKLVTPRQKEVNRAKIERLGYLIDQVDNKTATEAHKAEIQAILGIGEQGDIQKVVDAVKSRLEFQAPIKGPGRDEIMTGLKSVKDVKTGAQKFTEDYVSTQMALWDGLARSWAERNEKNPEDFYEERLIGFRQSAAAEVEAQAAQFQERTEGLGITPKPIEKTSAAPIPPMGKRWESNRGSMPGEPIAYLDGDEETGKAAIIERPNDRGDTLYEASTGEGQSLGIFQTAEEAAAAAELKYPILTPATTAQLADIMNRIAPEHQLKYDGIQEVPGKPDLYQFTPQDGPLKGRTFTVSELTPQAAIERLESFGAQKIEFQQKRGAIEWLGDTGQAIMHAFEAADASTPIHETGHLAMQMLYDEGLDDYLKAAKWAGVDEARAQAGYNQWTTDEKEKVARAFEAYVMEGKAPTMRLQHVFRKMKQWLMDIYRSVRRLDVKMTPEIRQVFDNLLTTEHERNEAPIPAEVYDWMNIDDLEKEIPIDDMASIEDINAEASRRVARAMVESRSKDDKKIKAALRKEAEKSIEANPIYEMLKEVRESGGFDKKELDFLYSADHVNDMIHRMPGLVSYSGAAKPDVVATRWGYYDTDELINAVMDSKTKEAAIEDYYQDLWQNYLIGLEYDAVNEYGKVIDEEIKILNSMLLEKKPTPQVLQTRAIFKGFEKIINAADQTTTAELQRIHQEMKAEEDAKINKMWDKYFQLKSRLIGEITALEQKSAQQLEDQKYDYLIKLDKKQREKEIAKIRGELAEQKRADVKKEQIKRLRGQAAERILKVKDQQKARVGEIRKKAKDQHEKRQIHARMKRHIRTNPDPAKPTIAIEYKAQVVALLKTYNYKVPKKFDQLPQQNAVDFINQIQTTDPYGAQALTDQMAELPPVKSKGMLALEELNEVARTADMLMHFGREEQSRRTGEARAQHDDTINKMIEPIMKTWGGLSEEAQRAIPTDLKMNRWKRLQQLKGKYSAELQKAEFILRALDGFKDLGPNWELYGKINQAFNAELELGAQFAGKLKAVFESRGFDKKWALQRYNIGFPELWTKEKLFMIALNSGNAQNLRYVKEGYTLSDDQIDNILNNILTAEEMTAVKDVWKTLGEMYPMLNKVHQTLTGVTLPKVEGNYFPLKLDRELSRTAAVFANKAVMQDLFASSAYYKASVAAPHRIARKRGGRRPQPLLSFSVLNEHLSKTVHDITHQIPVKEVQRLIHDVRFQKMAENALGTDVYDQLPKWLNYIARPQNEPAGAIEKFIGRLRRNTTIVGMGLKLSVAMVQPSAYSNTIDELGLIPSLTALKQFYASPRETVDFIKERSPMLRFHDQVWDRELRQFYGKFDPTQFGFSAWMKDGYFWLISMMDKAVRYPTWLAGYNAGMEKFAGDDAKAIEYADTVTRRTQGTAAPQDLAEVQRGGELKRMMTMFYTFFSLFQNRMTELARRRKVGDINMFQAFKSYWWILIFPAIAESVIRSRSIDDPKEMLKDVISFRMAGLPFVRDIANPILTGFQYSLTPIESAAEAPIWLAKSLMADEIQPEKVLKYGLSTSGYIWGLPAGQMNIFIEGLIDLAEDETDNPMRLFFREPRQKKQQLRR